MGLAERLGPHPLPSLKLRQAGCPSPEERGDHSNIIFKFALPIAIGIQIFKSWEKFGFGCIELPPSLHPQISKSSNPQILHRRISKSPNHSIFKLTHLQIFKLNHGRLSYNYSFPTFSTPFASQFLGTQNKPRKS